MTQTLLVRVAAHLEMVLSEASRVFSMRKGHHIPVYECAYGRTGSTGLTNGTTTTEHFKDVDLHTSSIFARDCEHDGGY